MTQQETARWAWHGGGLSAAQKHFGTDGAPWVDLSTGINPHSWPGANDVQAGLTSLPDEQELRELEAVAARYFATPASNICAVPGTEIGLRIIGRMLPGPAYYLAPSYRTHAALFGGATPIHPDELSRANEATLLLANPNNPDGRMIDRNDLHQILQQRGTQGWLLIDEAFADTTPAVSLASCIRNGRQLVIFRSFGKFFGLPGLRLGFVLGPTPLLDLIRDCLGAWPISAPAIAIGKAAYADQKWIAHMRETLREEAARLDAILSRHACHPIGRCPLFRLIKTENAQALFNHLARRHILTRPFDYNPHWLRIGLPGDAETSERLDAALADYYDTHG